MKPDPEVRREKYGWLRDALIDSGCNAQINYERQQTDALAVFAHPEKGSSGGKADFYVLGRKQSWFLQSSLGQLFQLTEPKDIASVAVTISKTMRTGANWADAIDADLVRPRIVPFDRADFNSEERSAQLSAWENAGWSPLPESDARKAWTRVDERIMSGKGIFKVRGRVFTWRIREQDEPKEKEQPLTHAILDAWRQCVQPTEHVLVLDWQHPCFRFFPHRADRRVFCDYWAKPVWPDGDSIYFLDPKSEFGVLGNWIGKLHIFGERLLELTAGPISDLLGAPKESGPMLSTR